MVVEVFRDKSARVSQFHRVRTHIGLTLKYIHVYEPNFALIMHPMAVIYNAA